MTDKPITTKVKVSKKWVGPKGSPVTVHLLADGVDTGKSLVLNEDSGWKGTFTDLREYNANGQKISYTVSEDSVDGYKGEVTGDMASGFTVTNTIVPTLNKPVKKTVAATGSSLVAPSVMLVALVVLAVLTGGIAYFMRRRGNK